MSDKILEAQRLALSFAEKSTSSLTANAHIRGLCKLLDVALAPPAAEQPNHSGDSAEMVHCACGDAYQASSYGAGFIDGSGMCPNCDAAIPAREPTEQPECQACSGHGLIGGFVSAESGYDAEECPECHGSGSIHGTECGACAEQPDTVKVRRELLERIAERGVIDDGMNFCPECGTSKEAVQDLRALLAGGEA